MPKKCYILNKDTIDITTDKVKSYVNNTLTDRFRIKTRISDTVARMIAVAAVTGDRSIELCLNGESVSLKNVELVITYQFRKNHMNI